MVIAGIGFIVAVIFYIAIGFTYPTLSQAFWHFFYLGIALIAVGVASANIVFVNDEFYERWDALKNEEEDEK